MSYGAARVVGPSLLLFCSVWAAEPQPGPAADASAESAARGSSTGVTEDRAAGIAEPTAGNSEPHAAAATPVAEDEKGEKAENQKEEKIDPHKATAAEIKAHNATAKYDDRVSCRMEALTGSHRRVKVCLTNAQRRAMREETQDALATAGRDSSGPLRGN